MRFQDRIGEVADKLKHAAHQRDVCTWPEETTNSPTGQQRQLASLLWVMNGCADNMSGTSELPHLAD
jgi:hypothetical protein